MVDVTQGHFEGIRISGDGSKVFCLSWKTIQAWSIQTGEVVGEVGLEVFQSQRSLTVEGSRAWVHSPFSEPLGWDFGTPGTSLVRLSNTPLLHANDTKVWDIRQSAIKDTVTGKVVFQLTGRFIYPLVSVGWTVSGCWVPIWGGGVDSGLQLYVLQVDISRESTLFAPPQVP